MSIKDRIKSLAKGKIRLEDLEKELGFSNKTISSWEHHQPKVSSLVAVADFFGVSVDYLLGRDADAQESDLLSKFRKMSSAHKSDLMRIAEGFADADQPIRKETQIS